MADDLRAEIERLKSMLENEKRTSVRLEKVKIVESDETKTPPPQSKLIKRQKAVIIPVKDKPELTISESESDISEPVKKPSSKPKESDAPAKKPSRKPKTSKSADSDIPTPMDPDTSKPAKKPSRKPKASETSSANPEPSQKKTSRKKQTSDSMPKDISDPPKTKRMPIVPHNNVVYDTVICSCPRCRNIHSSGEDK